MDKISAAYKSGIAKWCRIKIKVFKQPGKDKKVKDHKFDSGKNQSTFFVLIDKINEIIDVMDAIPGDISTAVSAAVDPISLALSTHEALGWTAVPTGEGAHGHTIASDRRLKRDVNIIGKSPSGLNIYTYKFTDSYRYGDGLYQGVMSDEVPQSVVVQDNQGYDMVDYDKIDVDFVKISDVK